MTAELIDLDRLIIPDDSPDASYLEQEGLGFEDRLEAYRAGDFGFVGIQAQATIRIPHNGGWILETITSPGLWGIEDDSGEDYFNEVYAEELETLKSMLAELGITVDTPNRR